MNVAEIYENDYRNHGDFCPDDTKYGWAATYVFELTTYDDSLDEMFVMKIIEVCKSILNRTTFDYINENETNYITYILVCNLLNSFNWIEWGTSIRGAWFQEQHYNQYQSRPILNYWTDKDGFKEVPFTIDNIKALICSLGITLKM